MKKLFLSALAMLAMASSVFALSPPGSPEYTAEMTALSKLRADFPSYRPITNQVQMRSNGLSVVLPATNRIGNRVDFKCYTRKVVSRSGVVSYQVSAPVFAN